MCHEKNEEKCVLLVRVYTDGWSTDQNEEKSQQKKKRKDAFIYKGEINEEERRRI
jgi:hypothetical protein